MAMWNNQMVHTLVGGLEHGCIDDFPIILEWKIIPTVTHTPSYFSEG